MSERLLVLLLVFVFTIICYRKDVEKWQKMSSYTMKSTHINIKFCIFRLSKIVSVATLTLILHSVKITLNTSFAVRNGWFQLLCRHRSIAGMPQVKMPHLFICHVHVTSVPHIIGRVLLGTGWMPQSGCGYPLTCSAHSTRARTACTGKYRVQPWTSYIPVVETA